jgi:hypothetical protein
MRLAIGTIFSTCFNGAVFESTERVMDKLYFGIGAALYLLFAAWCMVTPPK